MSRIKVCHFTSAHPSNDTRIFYKECTSLANAGYDVYLVAKGESREENGVNVIGCGEAHGRIQRMTGFAKKVYEKALALDCDIYHFHDPELLPYGLKLKKAGKKVIFDSHEDVVENVKNKTYIPSFLRGAVADYMSREQKKCAAQFDGIISVTPHICDKLKAINKNTVMVTNYPFKPLSKPVHNNNDSFTLAFAGGVGAQWSHEHIVKAIDGMGVTYKVFGGAAEAYLNALKELHGYKNVVYGGKIPFEQVEKEIINSNAAMALCQYSPNTNGKSGTLGNTKLFEGMAAGVPVICTDFDLWQKIIEKYNCGICVNPSDDGTIKSAVQYLISNPEKAKEMGENGYKAVMEEYNWEQQAKVLLDLYKNIAK